MHARAGTRARADTRTCTLSSGAQLSDSWGGQHAASISGVRLADVQHRQKCCYAGHSAAAFVISSRSASASAGAYRTQWDTATLGDDVLLGAPALCIVRSVCGYVLPRCACWEAHGRCCTFRCMLHDITFGLLWSMGNELIPALNTYYILLLATHGRTDARLSASPTNAFQGTISLGRSWTLF